MELVASLLIAVLYLGIAYFINEHNARYLLSGYNTMSAERRKQFDIKGYLVLFRKFFYVLGLVSLAIVGIAYVAGFVPYATIIIIALSLVSLPFLIIKGRTFDHYSAKTRRASVIGLVVLLVTMVGVGWIFVQGLRANELIIDDTAIIIDGMYGDVFDAASLREVSLVDALPALTMRTNGFALGAYRKGYFRTSTGEVVKLFINHEGPPYLKMVTDSQTYYWNTDPDGTARAYELVHGIHEN